LPANTNLITQIATAVKNIKFTKMKKLSRNEMKNVMGGIRTGGGATCTASCSDSTTVSIECTGDCTARDNVGAFCGTEKKCCNPNAPCFAS